MTPTQALASAYTHAREATLADHATLAVARTYLRIEADA